MAWDDGITQFFNGIGQGASGFANWITGDPKGVKAAYDAAIGQSATQGQAIKDFLMQQEEKAKAAYGPAQGMFNSMYGTAGMKPAQAPGTGGQQGIMGKTLGGGY